MSQNCTCGRCGHISRNLRKEWSGLFVCGDCFDHRHPQLDVRVLQDRVHDCIEEPYHFVSPHRGWADVYSPVVVGHGAPYQRFYRGFNRSGCCNDIREVHGHAHGRSEVHHYHHGNHGHSGHADHVSGHDGAPRIAGDCGCGSNGPAYQEQSCGCGCGH